MKHRSINGVFVLFLMLANTVFAQAIPEHRFETVAFESVHSKTTVSLYVYVPAVAIDKKEFNTVLYVPFAVNDSSLKYWASKNGRLLQAAIIVGIQNFQMSSQSIAVKPAVVTSGFGGVNAAAENYDALFSVMKDEIFPKMEEKYKDIKKHMLACTSEKFTSYILANYADGFHCHVSMQPFLLFDSRREIKLAKEFFANYSKYKDFDLSRLSAEEINWPDEMLIKLGVELPIYFQE